MLLKHAIELAEARSYVAALADHALTFDGAMEYERVLLELDELHSGVFPPSTEVPTTDQAVLFRVAYHAIAGLGVYDLDAFGLELCLAMLIAARESDNRS
jgi:hypothetical protein